MNPNSATTFVRPVIEIPLQRWRIELEGFDIEDKSTKYFLAITSFREDRRIHDFLKMLARQALDGFKDKFDREYEFESILKAAINGRCEYYLTFHARKKEDRRVLKTIQAVVGYAEDFSGVLLCRIKPLPRCYRKLARCYPTPAPRFLGHNHRLAK